MGFLSWPCQPSVSRSIYSPYSWELRVLDLKIVLLDIIIFYNLSSRAVTNIIIIYKNFFVVK